SDADYDALKAQYTAEVVTALRAESRDAGGEMRDAMAAGRTPHPASRLSHPDCPTHGARPAPNAELCSECGRRLGSAPGYCGRCGVAVGSCPPPTSVSGRRGRPSASTPT